MRGTLPEGDDRRAPHLHAYYPGLATFGAPWFYDRYYYGFGSRHEMVLDELRRRAIPPGA